MAAIVILTSCELVDAEDWKRFLGKNGAATSSDASIPTKWDAETNIKWKTKLPGAGTSSPIIVGNRVLLTCYTGYGEGFKGKLEDLARHLICFDRTNGEELWNKKVDNSQVNDEDPYKSFITQHGYATNTPVTDGKTVYVFFGKPGLYAYDLEGKELWHKKIEYKTNKTRWGSGAVSYTHLTLPTNREV